MKNKIPFVLIFLLLLAVKTSSQNEVNKWSLTFGSGSILYSQEDAVDIGYRYNTQFPRVSIGRYIFKNVNFVASISSSLNGSRKYTTFDGEARYDFGTSENRISPYILLGGGFIEAEKLTPTVNFGAGGTFWISDKVGLNGQIMYKFNEERFQSQRSHTFGSVGLIYRFSFSSSSSNNVIRDSRNKRIWNQKN
ncbi:MAG: hypothetical protein AB8B78_12115 [Polaribacter sp.]